MIRKLFPYIGKYKTYTVLAPAAVIIEVFLEVNVPRTMTKIVDIGIANRDLDYILRMGAMMIIMAVTSLIMGALAARFASIAGTGFSKEIRKNMFYKIQDYSFANIDKFSTASLVTRLTSDVTNTQMTFMMMLRMMIRAPIMLIMATFMAVSINTRLSAVFMVAIPFMGIALYFIATRAYPKFRTMFKKLDRLNAVIQENLIGIRVVKAFVRGEYEEEKFRDIANKVRETQRRAEHIVIWNMPVMQFAMYGCMLAISWFGGNLIIAGDMLEGELMGFISYVTQILMSLMMISMVFVMLVISRASVSRIVEVLEEKPDITEKPSSEGIPVEDGSIRFENVSFGYGGPEGNKVLENINLSIESGEVVGIIGGTGSAKTTLVQLIPRLYDVLDGKVIVSGRDVRDFSLKTLRNSVAMVLQNNVLFSGTIKENLKWGNENATDEEIIEACKAAQAHAFIMSFPNGYDTVLGQGGVNVSGGQKQRLCIARALLKKPKIIILDDSTSAVDTVTDAKIREALKKYLAGTTVIIIAQRIASVIDADKIVVMDDGKINAVGSHETLLETNPIYREVYESQHQGVVENVGA
ncbi:MAG: ABC transporter ATP-binding protein [Clostridiaceae bacterium]|nr:ABC transporter ATP-binding protein [Clostridiaceae bacterium]